MNYFSTLLNGLSVTLFVSFAALLVGLVLGAFVFWGVKSEKIALRWLSTAYIEIFEGIPMLVQLFVIYYVLPTLIPALTLTIIPTSIIVFSLNAIANIARLSRDKAENVKEDLTLDVSVKILLLSGIREFNKLIKYSTLLTMFGVVELLKAGIGLVSSQSNTWVIFAVLLIYLVMSLILRIAYDITDKKFFGNSPKAEISDAVTE